MKGRDGYTPLNVNINNSRQPGGAMLSDDNRYTSTPPPAQGKIPYYQQGINNHDIIETPISVNRPKFDFSG